MRIGIISLGLIGGSIYKDLSKNPNHKLICVTRNENTIAKIKNDDNIATKDYSVLSDCELIFVCSPMRYTEEILDKIEKIINKDCVVTDVCSVKGFLTKKTRPYLFIPSHPMAGTEKSGYESAEENLFKGAKWVVTPFQTEKNIEKLIGIIEELKATPVITTPEKHDEAVALISHLPMILSQTLFETAKDNELANILASSGFRDTTRLAMTNSTLAFDMLNINNEAIQKAKKLFSDNLDSITTNYENKIEEISEQRKKMYNCEGKNILKILEKFTYRK